MNSGQSSGQITREVLDPPAELSLTISFEEGPEGSECFVLIDDTKIAKRKDGAWAPLEPGWRVLDGPNLDRLVVEYNGVQVH